MQILWGSRHLIVNTAPQEIRDGNNRRWLVMQAQEVTQN
jgi:hypothetical protein